LAERCLATDEVTGGKEQALIDGYRERLIKNCSVVAIAATESLDRMMEKEPDRPNTGGELAKRSIGRANRRQQK